MLLFDTVTDSNGNKRFRTIVGQIRDAREKRYEQVNKDETALKDFFKLSESDRENQKDNYFKDMSAAAQEFAESSDGAADAIERFIEGQREAASAGNILKTTLKNVGAQLLAMGASALASYVISAGIQAAYTAYENYIHAVEDSRETLNEIKKSWDDTATSTKKAKDIASEYASEYTRLSQGVNIKTGENNNLSDRDYQQWLNINAEIANSTLSTVEGVNVAYDSQGRAIVELTGKIQTLSDAYGQLEKDTRQKIINDLDDVVMDTRTAVYKRQDSSYTGYDELIQIRDIISSEDDTATKYAELIDTLYKDKFLNLVESKYKDAEIVPDQLPGDLRNAYDTLDGHDLYTEFAAAILQAPQAIFNLVSAQETNIRNDLADEIAGAETIVTQAFKDGILDGVTFSGLDEKLQNGIIASIDKLPLGFFKDFNTSDDLVKAFQNYAKAFADGSGNQQVISEIAKAQSDFMSGQATWDQVKSVVETNQFDTSEVPQPFVDAILAYYGVNDESAYNEAYRLATNKIAGEFDPSKATRGFLDFMRGQDQFESMEAALEAYNRQIVVQTHSIESLASAYKTLTEQQSAAAGIMKDVGTANTLSLEQYNELLAANKEYAAAVVNNAGLMTIDYNKIRQINQAQIAAQQESVNEGWAINLSQQAQLQEEINELIAEASDEDKKRLEQKQQELKVLQNEAKQYEVMASQYKYLASSYKRWKDAQSVETQGAAFADSKNAVEAIEAGQASGRRNTEVYRAAMEYIFGDKTFANDRQLNDAVSKANSLFNKDGSLNLTEWRRQSAKVQDDQGNWKVSSIDDYAKALGYSKEFTAQAIKALSEYNGYQGVNVSEEWIRQAEELIPKTETELLTAAQEENTQVTKENTEATQQLVTLLSKNTAEQAGNVTLTNRPTVSKEAMQAAGWTEFDGDYGTLYAQTMSAGSKNAGYDFEYGKNVVFNFTPILPNGEILSPEAVEEYIEGLVKQSTETGKSIMELDSAGNDGKGIMLDLFAVGEGTSLEYAYEKASKLADKRHEDQAALYDDLANGGSESKPVIVSVQFTGNGEADNATLEAIQKGSASVAVNVDTNGSKNALEELTDTENGLEKPRIVNIEIKNAQDDIDGIVREADTISEKREVDVDTATAKQDIGILSDAMDNLDGEIKISADDTSAREVVTDLRDSAAKPITVPINFVKKGAASYRKTIQDLVGDPEGKNNIVVDAAKSFTNAYTRKPQGANLWDNIMSLLSGGNAPQPPKVEVDFEADTKDLEAKLDKTRKLASSKPIEIPVKINSSYANGDKGGSKSTILDSSLASIFNTKYASGTSDAKRGTALVGEAGREIWVDTKKNRWSLIDKPSLVNMNDGDIVYNNQQTEAMLKTKKNKGGKTFGDGTTNRKKIEDALKGTTIVSTTKASVGNSNSVSTPSNGKGSGSGSGNGGNAGADIKSILEALSNLYDWIPILLDNAQRATQKMIDKVSDFVGHVNQNAQLERALASTNYELQKNQEAYQRYLQQANTVQQQLGISDALAQKIRDGAIDIEQLDEDTKKKVEEYKKWYDLATKTLDTVDELRKQEHDLYVQRMDNIISDYKNRLDELSDVEDRVQNQLKLEKQIGKEITEATYNQLIDNQQRQLNTLSEEYVTLQKEFFAQIASGNIKQGSDEWHKYRNELEGIDKAIIDAKINMSQFSDEIYNIRSERLQVVAATLDQIQTKTEGIMGLHDAQGTKNVSDYYDNLIANGFEQIANLEQQNELIRAQMSGLDEQSEKYQGYLKQLRSNDNEIMSIKTSQEQWNDAIADLKIDALKDQEDELNKINDAYEKQIRYEEALEALEKAKNQRNKLIYRAGVGFVYEADQDAIDKAQKDLDNLNKQAQTDAINEAVEAIQKNKQDDNVWNYEGTALASKNVLDTAGISELAKELLASQGVIDVVSGISQDYQRLVATLSGGNAGAVTIDIGDINLSGVDNVEDLAKDIVQRLPNSILQELHKN